MYRVPRPQLATPPHLLSVHQETIAIAPFAFRAWQPLSTSSAITSPLDRTAYMVERSLAPPPHLPGDHISALSR